MQKIQRKKIKKYLLILIFVFSFFLATTSLVLAQDFIEFKPQIPIPGMSTQGGMGTDPVSGNLTSDLLGRYIQAIYNYGLSIAGILAAVVMMAGGLLWLTSGGSENKISQAKTMIFSSIVGLLILFSSWMILNTINPNLLKIQTIKLPALDGVKEDITGCCEYGAYSAIITTGSDCYFKNSQNGTFNRLEDESIAKILDYLKDKNVFFENKFPDISGTGKCVDPTCCLINFGKQQKLGWTDSFSKQDCLFFGAGYYGNLNITSNFYGIEKCSNETLLCDTGSSSWGDSCKNRNGKINDCWCFPKTLGTKMLGIGDGERNDPCGTRDGAKCMTAVGGGAIKSCPDGYSRSIWGRDCKNYSGETMFCCYPDN